MRIGYFSMAYDLTMTNLKPEMTSHPSRIDCHSVTSLTAVPAGNPDRARNSYSVYDAILPAIVGSEVFRKLL